MDKIHFKKSNNADIHLPEKYGMFNLNRKGGNRTKDGSSNYVGDILCVGFSLLFYVVNLVTDVFTTSGWISINEPSPLFIILALDLLFGIITLCLTVYSSKGVLNTGPFQLVLVVKSANFFLILALIICAIVLLVCEAPFLSFLVFYASVMALSLLTLGTIISFLLHVCKHRKNTNRKMTEE
jgi:hypothetical protein